MATEQTDPQPVNEPASEPSDLDIAMAAIDGKPEPTAEPAPEAPKQTDQPAQAAPESAKPTEAPGAEDDKPEGDKPDPSQWQQAIEAERQRLEAQRRDKDMVSLDDLRARAKENPQRVADDLGIGLDALLAAMAGPEQTPQEADADKAELVAALKRVEALEAAEKARQEQAQTATREKQYTDQLGKLTEMIGDRELCKTFSDRAVPLAFQTAVEICRQANITPSAHILPAIYNAALDSVEQHLEAEESERIEKARTTQKLGKLFGAAPQQAASAPAVNNPQPTIGDATGNTSAPPELSDEEIFLQGVDQGRKAEGRAPFSE